MAEKQSGKTVVNRYILDKWVSIDPFVAGVVKELESDEEVRALLEMSNVNAVKRLGYNDHGPVHARIVAGSAIELMHLLLASKNPVQFSALSHGTARSINDVKLILLLASYLHDIGNAVHRHLHEAVSSILAKDIVDRFLVKFTEHTLHQRILLRLEVLSAIYSTALEVPALTLEASIIKLADGLDMSEGRARIPYKLGKIDMHSLSALNVKRVELSSSDTVPIIVSVYFGDMAGFFQVEKVLLPKLESGKLKGLVRVEVYDSVGKLVTSIF
ncbi:MAG: HD domain-containing protein [Thermofilaceae archaeon]|nr:HD domain-containing protein [Thermofilaceae archaeon]MCX8180970.1 HD domain-containing protein [Thermofilaceae archaeon]MDW8004075.1 HD domain-containing protein [Thermofilaceae archaeon]